MSYRVRPYFHEDIRTFPAVAITQGILPRISGCLIRILSCAIVRAAGYAFHIPVKHSLTCGLQFFIAGRHGIAPSFSFWAGSENCGYNKNLYALDFAHKNKEIKLFSISIAISKRYGKEKIRKETEKCRLLCANCHREETYK